MTKLLRQLKRQAARSAWPIQICFIPRFSKPVKSSKRGRSANSGVCASFYPHPWTTYIQARPLGARLPGGVIGETGPHVVYMTLAFINPIRAVQVDARKQLTKFPWSPYEDYRLELMGDNASCSVALTYATNRWAVQLDLWGSEGHMKFDLETQTVVVHGRTDLKPVTLGLSSVKEAGQMLRGTLGTSLSYAPESLKTRMSAWSGNSSKAFASGSPAPVTPEEGREAVRVMDLIVSRLSSRRTERMCGISGIASRRLDRGGLEPSIERMAHAIRHRGPDGLDFGYFGPPAISQNVALAHNRLAIIDISAAGVRADDQRRRDGLARL